MNAINVFVVRFFTETINVRLLLHSMHQHLTTN